MRFVISVLVLFGASIFSGAGAQHADLQQQLQNGVAEARIAADLVGAGGIIMQSGEVVAIAVDGKRRKNADVLIESYDLWHIGSVTKSMTATLVARLVEQNALSFEDTLPELLPEMAAGMDPGWSEVTLHHLLTHTSGAPANFPVTTQFVWPEDPDELVAARNKQIATLLSKPPKAEPGEKFLYSNIGFTIAGHIAEVLTGVPYEALMEEQVFQPLGLASAGFGPPMGDNPWGHASRFFMKSEMDPENKSDNTPVIAPAGRVHMNLEDLARYGQRHLAGDLGQDGFLNAETYRVLHTPDLDDYAYGWVVMDREWAGGRLLWHNGSNTMWYALLVILPEKDMVMAFTTNDGRFREAEQAFFGLARDLAASSSQSPTTE